MVYYKIIGEMVRVAHDGKARCPGLECTSWNISSGYEYQDVLSARASSQKGIESGRHSRRCCGDVETARVCRQGSRADENWRSRLCESTRNLRGDHISTSIVFRPDGRIDNHHRRVDGRQCVGVML